MPTAKEQERTQELNIPVAGVRVPLPKTEDMLYYGGLGALTALQLIEWPVTLAVGAGYALATHHEGHRPGRQ
jgi:hypothetical protein